MCNPFDFDTAVSRCAQAVECVRTTGEVLMDVEQLLHNMTPDDKGNYGQMVTVRNNVLTTVSLEEVIASASMIGNQRLVEVDGEFVNLARNVGISFAE